MSATRSADAEAIDASRWASALRVPALPLTPSFKARLILVAAAAVAIAILKGKKVPGINGTVSGTKSVLLKPVWVTKKNYKLLFNEGFLKRSQVCIGQYKKLCK